MVREWSSRRTIVRNAAASHSCGDACPPRASSSARRCAWRRSSSRWRSSSNVSTSRCISGAVGRIGKPQIAGPPHSRLRERRRALPHRTARPLAEGVGPVKDPYQAGQGRGSQPGGRCGSTPPRGAALISAVSPGCRESPGIGNGSGAPDESSDPCEQPVSLRRLSCRFHGRVRPLACPLVFPDPDLLLRRRSARHPPKNHGHCLHRAPAARCATERADPLWAGLRPGARAVRRLRFAVGPSGIAV